MEMTHEVAESQLSLALKQQLIFKPTEEEEEEAEEKYDSSQRSLGYPVFLLQWNEFLPLRSYRKNGASWARCSVRKDKIT